MRITCKNCQNQIAVSDDKIPQGRLVHITCPKCKNRIPVEGAMKSKPLAEEKINQVSLDSENYDASNKPFDLIEEDTKTAIICESDGSVKKLIAGMLEEMDYRITEAESARDALRRMRYHAYDLVIIDEVFDSRDTESNGVLIYIRQMHMNTRRSLFVVLISENERSLDSMAAFKYSVNMVINLKDIKHLKKVIFRAIAENEIFYRMYKSVLKEVKGL